MMDLRAVVEGYPGSEGAAYAWLNLAICAMHFGDYAGAHEYLQKAKAELPLRRGSRAARRSTISGSPSTLGYRPQAVEAYRAAAELKGGDADRQRRPSGLGARHAQSRP
jgi:tetratricopeptide (TPR) repeat protein